MFLNTAYAMGQGAQAGAGEAAPPMIISFLPIILVFIVFYFLVFRSHSKKQKEQAALVNSIQRGDHVVTQGGIFGTVQNVDEKTVILKVDDSTTIKVLKSVIGVKLDETVK